MAQRQGVSRLNGRPKSFFLSSSILTVKITKVPGAPRNVNLAWAKTYQNHLLYQLTFNNNSPPPHLFLRGKMLLKKK